MAGKADAKTDWLCCPRCGGNIIYVDPDRDMVVAIASRFKPASKDRIGSIRKYVVPAFGGSGVALAEG